MAKVISIALPLPEKRPGKIKIKEHLSLFDHTLPTPKPIEVATPSEAPIS